MVLLRRIRVRPGYLFELDPLLTVLAGQFLRDDNVALALVILGQLAEIPEQELRRAGDCRGRTSIG